MDQDFSSQIEEHMKVVGSDGAPVGTVDRIEGEQLKLTRSDEQAGGQHHFLPIDKVAAVNGRVIELNCSAEDAMNAWTGEGDESTTRSRGKMVYDKTASGAPPSDSSDAASRRGPSKDVGSKPQDGNRTGAAPSTRSR